MADLSMITAPGYMDESHGPSITATASLMIFFCTAFVGMRYYARYLTSTSLSIEDAIIPFAWVAVMGLCIVAIVMVKKAGTGRHMAYILSTDPSKIAEHFKGIMILEVLHPAAVAFPKLTVVMLYLHILTNKYERIVAKILVVLILATWISYTIAAMFQCMPFAFNWDKTIPNGRCFNVQFYANSSSVPNMITDLAVLVLPLRSVWGLKISVGRRVGLLLIFLTGSIGIVASIIRTIVFARTLAESGPLTNVTFNHVSLVIWTIIEPAMYLLSACALSFKPLFRMFARALHLQAFITHTKSTFVANKTYAKKTSASTHLDMYHMQQLGDADVDLGRAYYRMSEDSSEDGGSDDARAQKRIEVLVARTMEGGGGDGEGYAKWEDDVKVKDFEKGVGTAV